MDAKPYPYTPLHGDQIRYLTLHAFDESLGVVQCSLHHASLPDIDGRFTALSYVWGDAGVTVAIHLSGHPFNVTTNLAVCLRQLATNPKYQGIRLWVDAICINQQDVDERNAQVQRMGDIYSLANSVIAWLGPDTELSHLAMQRLQNIKPSEIEAFEKSTEMDKEERGNEIFDELLDNDGEEGLLDLLLRPYWSRTWIVQEIQLGREAHLLCGNDEVTMERMDAVMGILSHVILVAAADGNRFSRAGRLWECLDGAGAFEIFTSTVYPQKALYHLANFREHRCSDPRDKVYALLGIMTGSGVERVIPDYGRPVAKVYQDVVETHIRSHDDLDFLMFAGYGGMSDPDMASWIPDWRTPMRIFGFRTDPYYASNRLALSSHPWSLDQQTQKLHLTGVCLDTITTLSTQFEFHSSDRFASEGVTNVAMDCLQLVYQTLTQGPFKPGSFAGFSKNPDEPSYPLDDSEYLAQACRRTLVADHDWAYVRTSKCTSSGSPFMFLLPGEEGRQRSDGSVYTHADTIVPCSSILDKRKLATTSKGWIGLVPGETELGDHVSVLIGAMMPVILRKASVDTLAGREEGGMETGSAGDEFLVVGNSYIHGLMYGKGLELAHLGNITLR